jgi:hypothetical protein
MGKLQEFPLVGWRDILPGYGGGERSRQSHDILAQAGTVRHRNTIQNGVLDARIIIAELKRNGEADQLGCFCVRQSPVRRILAVQQQVDLVGQSQFLQVAQPVRSQIPMAPIQVLTNNLLYDFSQVPIPADAVDEEQVARPRPLEHR